VTDAERLLLLKVARRLLIHGCNTDSEAIQALVDEVVSAAPGAEDVEGEETPAAAPGVEPPTKSIVLTGAAALAAVGRGSERPSAPNTNATNALPIDPATGPST
jgi:hypothetical protein